jgi:predicted TIM-barrel fold metal-dependent hydrolase
MSAEVRGKQQKPVTSYLRENFYVTTAGHFRSQPLLDTLLEIGADRLLFSVDYPYETVQEQVEWFDNLAISETDRRQIGRENALELLRLSPATTKSSGANSSAAAKSSVTAKSPVTAK